MDPNVTLANILRRAIAIIDAPKGTEPSPDDARTLAADCLVLHDWIKAGGFLPKAWEGKQ